MGDVARKEGRTILFVSHNMAGVQSLCQTGVLLVQGKVTQRGLVDEVVRGYAAGSLANRLPNIATFPGRQPKSEALIQRAMLLDQHGTEMSALPLGAALTIRLCLSSPRRISRPIFGIGIDNYLGQRIVSFNSEMNTLLDVAEISRPTVVDCVIPCLPLAPGDYRVKLVVRESGTDLDIIEDALAFTVEATDWFGTGRLPHSSQGTTVCKANWEIKATESFQ
jgi:lipopolysaccharide transport system ATP-binding protein